MYSNIYLRMNNNNNILNDRAAQWSALLGSVDDIIKNNNIDDIYDPVIIDNLKDINNKKLFLAERARKNYAKRKAEGRQKIKHIAPEEQKKAGRPKGTTTNKKEPKQRGRPVVLINDVSHVPEYLKKLIKDKTPNTADNIV